MKKTNFTTDHALILAESLESNNTLKKLNLEDNAINPPGFIALGNALKNNKSLLELRIVNQKSPLGNEAETVLADMMEENFYLEKIVVVIKNGGARTRVNKFETRNREFNRRRRRGENIEHLLPKKETTGETAPVVQSSNSGKGDDHQETTPTVNIFKQKEAELRKKKEEERGNIDNEEDLRKLAYEEKKKKEEEALRKKQEEESKKQVPVQKEAEIAHLLNNVVLTKLNELEEAFKRIESLVSNSDSVSTSINAILQALNKIGDSFTRIEQRLQ